LWVFIDKTERYDLIEKQLEDATIKYIEIDIDQKVIKEKTK